MLFVSFKQWFFSYNVKRFLGPVNILQDQYILGVTGPTGPVPFWVSVEACITINRTLLQIFCNFFLILTSLRKCLWDSVALILWAHTVVSVEFEFHLFFFAKFIFAITNYPTIVAIKAIVGTAYPWLKDDILRVLCDLPLSVSAGMTRDILGLMVLLCAVAGSRRWSRLKDTT